MCKHEEQNNKNNDKWIRHYDNLLWIVTTIFATGIGGLLVHVHSNFNFLFAIFGLLITPAPVYFASDFRRLRFKHSYTQNDKSKHLPQWPAYVAIFVGLEILWGYLLISHTDNLSNLKCLWTGLTSLLIFSIIWIGYLGSKPTMDKNQPNKNGD